MDAYMYLCNTYGCKHEILGIYYRGVQWEGGAVDGGSIIM